MTVTPLSGYTELRTLGSGGFGRVVLARHAAGALVAIKYLNPTLIRDRRFVAEFRREATVLHGLSDPHIVRVYEYVESAAGAAIVMEAIDGVSLRALLDERGALSPEAALTVLKGSLLGLGAAHAAGVVHRDFKPPNVLVRADGRSTLIDFGIALRTGEAGQIIGTPPYMAPEQWRGAEASPATDVYAATCVFYECVTGRTPYDGPTAEKLRAQHLMAPVPLADVPESLRGLVIRGMAKDPAERPHQVLAFAAELEAAAGTGYGRNWERNGWKRMAEAAGGLAALFPLAALAGGQGAGAASAGGVSAGAASAGAGSAGGSSAAGAAGHAAKSVAPKLLLKGLGGKVTAAVVGAAVVGGVGTGAVIARMDQPKRPSAGPMRVQLAAYDRPVSGVQLRGGQFAQVTGIRDVAVRRKVNAALRAPVDWGVAEITTWVVRAKDIPCPQARVMDTRTEIGLRGPRLVSVRYTMPVSICVDAQLPHVAVTVDTRTGRTLTAADVFRSETLSPSGLAALKSRVLAKTGEPPTDRRCVVNAPLTRQDFENRPPISTSAPAPPRVSPFFTSGGLAIMFSKTGSECVYYSVTLPYAEARDLLTPQIAALLPR